MTDPAEDDHGDGLFNPTELSEEETTFAEEDDDPESLVGDETDDSDLNLNEDDEIG